MRRRDFLRHAGLVLAAGAAAGCDAEPGRAAWALPWRAGGDEWDDVRAQFRLSRDWVHMSALLIASHPRPVREAIERHRRELDRNPVVYLHEQNRTLRAAAVERLRERRVIATVTPYADRYARLTPSIRNTPAEVDRALEAVRALA